MGLWNACWLHGLWTEVVDHPLPNLGLQQMVLPSHFPTGEWMEIVSRSGRWWNSQRIIFPMKICHIIEDKTIIFWVYPSPWNFIVLSLVSDGQIRVLAPFCMVKSMGYLNFCSSHLHFSLFFKESWCCGVWSLDPWPGAVRLQWCAGLFGACGQPSAPPLWGWENWHLRMFQLGELQEDVT